MKRKLALVLATVMTVFCVGCGGAEKGGVVETYQQATQLNLLPAGEKYDYVGTTTSTLQLLGDGTYVLQSVLTDGVKTRAEGEKATDFTFMGLATFSITQFGTYSLEEDKEMGVTKCTLSEANRMIYSTNAGGGHYPLVPADGSYYMDSADEKQKAAFETEWWGTYDEFHEKFGAEKVLELDPVNHMISKDNVIIDYTTCHFYTLGEEIPVVNK